MKKTFKSKSVSEFHKKNEHEEIESALRKLWKQYHLISGKEKKILHTYLTELENKLKELDKKENPIVLVADIETGEKLSNYVGDETFIILLKSKSKHIVANDKKKRILVQGNNSIYIGPNTISHKNLIKNVIANFAQQKFKESELSEYEDTINHFAQEIMESKHYFAGRYSYDNETAYIWDFPNEDIIKTLQTKYPNIKEIRY